MKDTPISKTQSRALRLLGLSLADTYNEAASMLEARGFSRDGMPFGHTWRTAGKLSDEELVNLLNSDRSFRESEDTVVDGFGGVQ